MDGDELRRIEDHCEPIVEELEEYLIAVWLYGSAARGTATEGSDYDINVLVDDTHPDFDEATLDRAEDVIREVSGDAPDDLPLHFQPPKVMSNWWELMIAEEPWALTATEDAVPIYDEAGYVELTRDLLDERRMQRKDLRAHRLLERSRGRLDGVDEILLEKAPGDVRTAMTKAAQAVLLHFGVVPPAPDEISDALRRHLVEGEEILDERAVRDYRTVQRTVDRLERGALEEFSAEELDGFLGICVRFNRAMESIFGDVERRNQEALVERTYAETLDLCEQALAETGVDVPGDAAAVFEAFREEFVETGRIGGEYWEFVSTVLDLSERIAEEDVEAIPDEPIHAARANLRDFEAALENVTRNLDVGVFEGGQRVEDADLAAVLAARGEAVEAMEAFADELLADHGAVVTSIWVLTIDEFHETDEVTAVVLFDDRDAGEPRREDLVADAREVSDEVAADERFVVHPTVTPVTEYWRRIRAGDPETIAQVREGTPLYDGSRFMLPVKSVIEEGAVPATREHKHELLEEARGLFNRAAGYRTAVARDLGKAVVSAGEAALVHEGISPPVPRRLTDTLNLHLVADGPLSAEDVRRADDVVSLWKRLDHDEAEDDELVGENIDEIHAEARAFVGTVEDLLAD